MYVGNLHEKVTERDLVKLFGLRTTNYLTDKSSIKMSNLQQNIRQNGHAFILVHCHVCDELVKVHGLEFHGRKIIIEEAKTPPRTLITDLFTSAVANDQKVCLKYLPSLTMSDQDYQQHLQKNNLQLRTFPVDTRRKFKVNKTSERLMYVQFTSCVHGVNSTYSDAVIPKKKDIALFSDSIPQGMKMKHLISQVKERRIHLTAFPGAKANQLYHFDIRALEEFDYDCAMIHVGINDMV